MTNVTRLLDAAARGDGVSADELLPLVYAELRLLAAQKMAHEAEGQTLQPTALVHEAWMKLAGSSPQWNNQGHFFAAAAEAMRRILIAEARLPKYTNESGPEDRGNDWIIAHILMREAKALIQADSTKAGVNSQ